MSRPVRFIIDLIWSREDCPPVNGLKWLLKRLWRVFRAKCTACQIEPEDEVER